jgi:hypothetical protein
MGTAVMTCPPTTSATPSSYRSFVLAPGNLTSPQGDVTPVRPAALLGKNVGAVGMLWDQTAGRSQAKADEVFRWIPATCSGSCWPMLVLMLVPQSPPWAP